MDNTTVPYSKLPYGMDVPYSRWKVPSLLLIPLILCFGILVFVDVFQLQYYSVPDKLHFLDTSKPIMDSFLDVDRLVDAKSLKGFAIKTSGCRIPYMNPFDKSVKSAISEPKVPKCNNGTPPLFSSNLTHLFVVQSSLAAYNIVYPYDLNCCYQKFYRVDPKGNNADNNIEIDKECIQINLTQAITEEFIKLTCKYDDNVIYKDLFAFVPVKLKSSINNDGKLNVLVIGLDAVSRVNFHRQMPHTAAYLKEIGALELMGYNKVGDNTFPNLIPVLTGQSEEEISKKCWSNKKYFDNCTFLWNLYKKAGYTTAFGEDSTWMGIFNYNRKGFKKQPTDYAYGYFNRLAENEIGNSHNMNVYECIGGRDVYKALLDYIKIFAERMDLEKMPYFGFFWGASLSHDYLNKPKLGDYYYKSFFQKLAAENLKNTVLIFMSDHGIRWGPIRQTYQGRLEERLPFVYIKLPDWFIQKYPLPYRNLIQNTRRLTTPFDLHYTIKSLMSLDNLNDDINRKKEHGYNLFSRIPDSRTCADAGITSHWCTCQQSTELDVNDGKVVDAAKFAVKEMNSMLVGYAQCAELSLDKITNARQMSHQNNSDIHKGNSNFQDYMLTLQTVPGEGIFETTIRLIENEKSKQSGFKVIGTISRLNLYGKQSACITDYHLKLYCYCKSLI